MVRRVVGASAGAGAGDDDGKDNREVRRFFEASARNLKMLNRPAPKTCARCQSENTHFSYYNNNQLTQPRFFCKTCRRFWTHGGALRNVPYGGRKRKNPPRHRKVVPTDIPSGDSLQQELIMPPQVLNSGQFAEVTEASLRMMPDLLLNHPQELPRWFTGESSVNPPPPPTPPQPLPQPQPQPQPQQQQQEVVNLNHADIDDDDDDDDLSYILQWSLDELLGSDDD